MCSICLETRDWTGSFHFGKGAGTSAPQYAGGTTQGVTGNALADGLISGTKWNSTALTYSFPSSSTQFTSSYTSVEPAPLEGFQALTSGMQTAARATFAELSSYTNLSFTELAPATAIGSVDITLARTTSTTTAFAYFPGGSVVAGDAWFGSDTSLGNPVRGAYGWLTMLHELGHSMGLKHGHEDGGVAGAVVATRDSMEFSLMSYRSYVGAAFDGAYSNQSGSYAQTFMMLDIAALQAMYGADFTTNASNSVYTFDASTGQMLMNGVGEGAPGSNRIFRTVWDGGGIDTYDYSNYTNAQSISLAAGRWSLFSTAQRADLGDGNLARANVYNAMQFGADERSLIENAFAGSGNDSVEGNQIANTLMGNGGDDQILGQGGNDTLSGGLGNDILRGDFAPPPAAPVVQPATYAFGSGVWSVPGSAYSSAATALNVMSSFSLGADADIESATTIPHTTVNVTSSGTVANYFKVMLNAGNRLVVDMDRTLTSGYDSYIRLLNADGGTVAENDDSPNAPDAGSIGDGQDSFLSFTAVFVGTYTIAVGSYLANGSSLTFANAATQYKLNISIENIPPALDVTGNLGIAGDDTLDGGDGNDTLYGGAGADNLTGGVGDDTIYGEEGDDNFYSGAGNDIMDGGAGASDILYYLNSTGSVIVNLVTNVNIGGDAEGDKIYGIERVFGSNNADWITGDAANNTIYGHGSNDLLFGGDGEDILYAGVGEDYLLGDAGNDWLYGDEGEDNFYGGAGIDRMYGGAGDLDILYYYDSTASVVVNLATNANIGGDAEGDLIFDIERVFGSNSGDSITGNDGTNVLYGYGGNDLLIGGGGFDTLTGGLGGDTFAYTDANYGVDIITDFEDGADKLRFAPSIADDISDLIIYNNGTNSVVIGRNNGTWIVVEGGGPITLTNADFIFA